MIIDNCIGLTLTYNKGAKSPKTNKKTKINMLEEKTREISQRNKANQSLLLGYKCLKAF